jgi:NAD(P)-dependent dehydrogenase (short-subunit alcohol dehydrogenase family)
MDIQSLFSLEHRVALITGGSRGIGAMIAEGFVAAGCRVYIIARTTADLERTAERLSGYPGECVPIVGDLSTTAGIEAVATELERREDALNILVNNAALESRARFEEFTEAAWDEVMNLNLRSVFFTTQRMLPLLRRGGSSEQRASVINLSSITATKTGAMGDYSYRASKAGLNQLTRMLGKDLAGEYVNVNAISPGFFKSALTSFMFDDETLYERFKTRNPVPREGHPHEIAGLAIYLASRAGNYMTGAVIDIDGGLSFVN